MPMTYYYVSTLHMGHLTGVTFSNEEFSSLIKLLFGTLDSALGPTARTFLNIERFRNYNFFFDKNIFDFYIFAVAKFSKKILN